MTTTTLTLVEFLTQRIDEDEAAARAADVAQGDPAWHAREVGASGGEQFTVRSMRDARPVARVERIDGILDGSAVAHHIARHDPARVLREVQAHRRMVEELWLVRDSLPVELALCALASVYDAHPDFREEWRA